MSRMASPKHSTNSSASGGTKESSPRPKNRSVKKLTARCRVGFPMRCGSGLASSSTLAWTNSRAAITMSGSGSGSGVQLIAAMSSMNGASLRMKYAGFLATGCATISFDTPPALSTTRSTATIRFFSMAAASEQSAATDDALVLSAKRTLDVPMNRSGESSLRSANPISQTPRSGDSLPSSASGCDIGTITSPNLYPLTRSGIGTGYSCSMSSGRYRSAPCSDRSDRSDRSRSPINAEVWSSNLFETALPSIMKCSRFVFGTIFTATSTASASFMVPL
mmetsp:Transcript_996/g.3000  ORF Transcript_996/g.3000 Transcript_996/m.3000 type:complete len:278 (+) Transcript_996:83-916(+)